MANTVTDLTTDQVERAIAKAREAMAAFSIGDETFLPASLLLARAAAGFVVDPLPLLHEWDTRATTAGGSVRYPWPFTHTSLRLYGHWTGSIEDWSAWRPRDQAALAENPDAFIGGWITTSGAVLPSRRCYTCSWTPRATGIPCRSA